MVVQGPGYVAVERDTLMVSSLRNILSRLAAAGEDEGLEAIAVRERLKDRAIYDYSFMLYEVGCMRTIPAGTSIENFRRVLLALMELRGVKHCLVRSRISGSDLVVPDLTVRIGPASYGSLSVLESAAGIVNRMMERDLDFIAGHLAKIEIDLIPIKSIAFSDLGIERLSAEQEGSAVLAACLSDVDAMYSDIPLVMLAANTSVSELDGCYAVDHLVALGGPGGGHYTIGKDGSFPFRVGTAGLIKVA